MSKQRNTFEETKRNTKEKNSYLFFHFICQIRNAMLIEVLIKTKHNSVNKIFKYLKKSYLWKYIYIFFRCFFDMKTIQWHKNRIEMRENLKTLKLSFTYLYVSLSFFFRCNLCCCYCIKKKWIIYRVKFVFILMRFYTPFYRLLSHVPFEFRYSISCPFSTLSSELELV